MRIPKFNAESSLTASRLQFRTTTAMLDVHATGRVIPQIGTFSGGYVDLEECWQLCIPDTGDCPSKCEGVPWPTIPPSPRVIKRI
jgi:hypothetical protein